MKSLLMKYGQVLAGGAIQGFGMGLFLFPQYIPSGGAGGMTVLLNYWFGVNMATALWIVNFSLLLLGLYVLGKRFAIWTVLAITMTSLSVGFFEQMTIPNRNLLLDLLIGSIFLGIGIGLLMRQNVSNGGIGVVALILTRKYGILPGRSLFWINSLIFLFAAIVIDLRIIILALVSQWIATQMVNLLVQLSFTAPSLSFRKK